MKVLYCNPIFLDYRLPFYKELNRLFKGNFYIMFSKWRYEGRRSDLLERILNEMGANAIAFEGDKVFDPKKFRFVKHPTGKRIPVVRGLIRRLIKENPDVIISEGFMNWTPFVILYSIITKTPMFIGFEGTLHTERNIPWIFRLQRKVTDWFTRGYLVNGKESIKYLKSLGIKESKIYVGGMSADSKGLRKSISEFSDTDRASFRAKYNDGSGLLYLFCGRVEAKKGAPHLMKAWDEHIKIHSNDCIVLVGIGDSYEILKEKYKNDAHVFLEGHVPYQSVHKYYAIADVFILPTLQDNWSLVIPEAMSCGLPVSTSIYNGCYSELVFKGKNGFVFDTLKNNTIVEALDYFHHVDLHEFGMNSIEIEKRFNTINSAQREYEGIMNGLNR